ncbi:hypothetical protein [Deefgea sp. CFH1-16]|uniref:hypothetical protein n=1 Tax=Deefgea sp. CFH1-16 TaxID=2675457 RepID=UPI0015F41757|nr:hypothetical protein [Deefgea sp. CFH1-16]MBM5575835.1 hypothetical protein [Deefgea sp. CFH1-16]
MFSLTEKPKENAFSSPNGNVAAVGQGGGDYVKQTAYALDAGNPLMESAKRKAMEIANARGLVNSTIGQANAVDAMGQVAATLGR